MWIKLSVTCRAQPTVHLPELRNTKGFWEKYFEETQWPCAGLARAMDS